MRSLENNSLKHALQNGRLTIGSWLSIPSPVVTEIMAQAGFDWLVVDMEHSVVNLETMQAMLLAIEAYHSIPLVRLSANDPVQTKRVMDSGAYGVVVPMVNTQEQAEMAVKAVKYPPWGNRGVGLARAQGYGMEFESYEESVNDYSVVICQIEHREAVENIDAILSVKGVDAVFIGPYDISGSYGIPGELNHPHVIEAEKRVLQAAQRHGIPAGIHVVSPDIDQVKDKTQKGFRLIAYSVDMLFLAHGCREGNQQIREILKSISDAKPCDSKSLSFEA